jgi:hypothetical protein
VVVVAVLDGPLDPLELLVADHRPAVVVEDPPAARIDDQQPHPAEVATVRPHRALRAVGLAVGVLGEGPQEALGVVRFADLPEGVVGGEAGGTQVAEVLVDPVRHQTAGDPLLPPVGRLHVRPPGVRGVPVVAASWSSKIIETGTVEKSQRMTGSVHASGRAGVLLEVRDFVLGGFEGSRRRGSAPASRATCRPRRPGRRRAGARWPLVLAGAVSR